jgi:hypothetical protein
MAWIGKLKRTCTASAFNQKDQKLRKTKVFSLNPAEAALIHVSNKKTAIFSHHSHHEPFHLS